MSIALACDLDGTLIKHNHGTNKDRSILKKDIVAIHRFTEEGNLFIVSTGRVKPLMFSLFDEYHLHLKNTYYIASNGAEIYDVHRKQIHKNMVSAQVIKQAYHIFKNAAVSHPLIFHLYDGNRNYELQYKDSLVDHQEAISLCIESTQQDSEYIKNLYTQFATTLEHCGVSMNNWYINIVAQHSSKASAIQYILSLQPHTYHVCAIGDAHNDVCMFDCANESFTFHSSSNDIKQQVDHIVDHVYECIDYIRKVNFSK